MQDKKEIVESKLGCSIEEFVEKESKHIEQHRGYECKRQSPFLKFTREDFYVLKEYCIEHKLKMIY